MARVSYYGVVYLRWCDASQKGYVGQTTQDAERRWRLHCRCAKSTRTPAYKNLFSKAIRKYGADGFSGQILAVANSPEELANLEKLWIILLQTKAPNGYNLTDGGEGCPGHPMSSEVKALLSAKAKAQWQNPEFRQLYHQLRAGKHQPEEAVARRALAQRGRRNPRAVEAMNSARRGSHHTFAAREKMRLAHLGIPWSEARRAAHERRKSDG